MLVFGNLALTPPISDGVRRDSEALGGFSYSQEFVESRIGEILDGVNMSRAAALLQEAVARSEEALKTWAGQGS